MSREQLWSGLLLRARDPGRFNPALSCHISDDAESGFVRHVRAGEVRFRERVELAPMQSIHTRTDGKADQIFAESITTIEEPASGYLFVRFIYRRELAEGGHDELVGSHLKSAYKQLDLEAIALIRLLAESEHQHSALH